MLGSYCTLRVKNGGVQDDGVIGGARAPGVDHAYGVQPVEAMRDRLLRQQRHRLRRNPYSAGLLFGQHKYRADLKHSLKMEMIR
jgi:hypothetical protein